LNSKNVSDCQIVQIGFGVRPHALFSNYFQIGQDGVKQFGLENSHDTINESINVLKENVALVAQQILTKISISEKIDLLHCFVPS